jgi:UDP-glucuronate 4-epimerase
MKILVTGGAGFIGSHLVDVLLKDGHQVVCIDNFHDFYSIEIKNSNIAFAMKNSSYELIRADINSINDYESQLGRVDVIIHLAARAGIGPSIENAQEYYHTNVKGTVELLEFAKRRNVSKFIYASSSSVYGINENTPWNVDDMNLLPISPYAASKIAGEKAGYTYSHLYDIQFIAFRFFTVYGPRQRPDLAIHKFVRLIDGGEKIHVYGDGSTSRDYTYIDDIVQGIVSGINFEPETNFSVFNLGNNRTVKLSELIDNIEDALGKKAIKEFKEEQPGDVPVTSANIEKTIRCLNYQPNTPIEKGIVEFVKWYKTQYKLH